MYKTPQKDDFDFSGWNNWDVGGSNGSWDFGGGDTSPPNFGNDGGPGVDVGTDPYGGGNVDNGGPLNPSNGGSFGGLGNNALGMGGTAAALATAYQQWRQSRQYTDFAERYAKQLDPFGEQRGQYQDLLSESYKDPSKVLNDPAHMAELQHGMDSVGRSQAAKGYLGSGNMLTALNDYSRLSDANWLQNYRQGLTPLTGAQFGPASAGHMLETGLMGRMGSENAALGALFTPFGAQGRGGGGDSGGGGFLSTLGQGLGIAGSVASLFSDRRLKSNIEYLGMHRGNKWYRYNIGGRSQIGVMADEVNPDAVTTHWSGYKMVNYGLL